MTWQASGNRVTVYDGATYDGFPFLVTNPNTGTLIAGWRNAGEHLSTGASEAWVSRSTDDGATWSAPIVAAAETDVAISCVGLAAYRNGEIVMMIIRNTDPGEAATRTARIIRSTDDGLTWTAPEATVTWPGTSAFPTMLALVDDGSPDGILMATAYDIGPDLWTCVVSESRDRGLTWTPAATLPAIPDRHSTEPWMLDLGGGELLCTIRSDAGPESIDNSAIYTCRSTDFGVTWDGPTLTLSAASGMPTTHVAPDGNLLMQYRDYSAFAHRRRFAWADSTDRGVTWTTHSGDFRAPGHHRWLYGGWANTLDGDVIAVISLEASTSEADVYAMQWDVVAGPPPAPAPKPLPPLTTAVARRAVTWKACDLITGKVLADLPELRGQIGRVVGAYTSSSLTLPIPLAGPGALTESEFADATAPGIRMLVAVINDRPTWGGIVLTRSGGTDAALSLGCVSLEGYMDRRYVRDHSWPSHDQASVIAASLIDDANVKGIGLVVDAPPSGVKRSREYFDKDDATVYQRLRELAAVQAGPEWTIDVEWTDDTHTSITKIIRVRDRIGVASDTPNALFEARSSSETTYTYAEDYTGERGANDVMATAAGEGEDRLQSNRHVDVRDGWPTYERRYAADTGSDDQIVLDDHAAAELALMVEGAKTWTLSSRWDKPPRLNLDWSLGDDVAWELAGHRHRNGVKGRGRAIGWNLDLQSGIVEPVLWAPNEEAL